jgi:nucleotide-binding universal stress UspA family protein
VVVVPSFWTEDRLRRVVVGVRSGQDARIAVARAFAEAAWRRCPLTVVMAWSLPDPYLDRIELRTHEQDWVTAGTAEIEKLVDPHRSANPDLDVAITVRHGRPASVLLAAADGSDLLVVTRRRFALPPHERLGGVGQALLRASDVPVLVVPCP